MGLHCHMTKSYKAVDTLPPPPPPPQTKILATPLPVTSYLTCINHHYQTHSPGTDASSRLYPRTFPNSADRDGRGSTSSFPLQGTTIHTSSSSTGSRSMPTVFSRGVRSSPADESRRCTCLKNGPNQHATTSTNVNARWLGKHRNRRQRISDGPDTRRRTPKSNEQSQHWIIL